MVREPDYTSVAPKSMKLTGEEELYRQDVKAMTQVELTNDQMYWRRLAIKNNSTQIQSYSSKNILLMLNKRF